MVEIIVKGRPLSQQASSQNRTRWKNKVASEARKVCATPLNGDHLLITIRFFYNTLPDFDTDNISKPICDALNGIAYLDDSQLEDRNIGRRDIKGSYHLQNVSHQLAQAIADGQDFVYIRIEEPAPGGGDI